MARDDAQPLTRRPQAWARDGCVFGYDDEVAAWVAAKLAEPYRVPPSPRAVGLMHKGALCGGAIFEQYDSAPHNVFVTVAVNNPRVFNRRTLGRWFWYPFRFLNCSRITTFYAETNAAAEKFNFQIGMKVEARLRGAAYDGSDLVVNRMLRDECPWDWSVDP